MERLRARQQAAHHDAIRERVPAPLLPTCAAQRLCPHPSLRLSRQRSPYLSPRARSPAARLPASAKFTSHQLPVSHLALPTLRSQHAHRAQPHRATTGVSMRASRHFLIPASSRAREDVTARLGPPVSSVRSCDPITYSCLQAVHEITRPREIYLPCRLFQPEVSSLFVLSMQANSRH